MFKLNSSHMQHPTFIKKVLRAIHKSKRMVVSHVLNSKGIAVLAVRYRKDNTGKMGYVITDSSGVNMAHELAKAANAINRMLISTLQPAKLALSHFFIKHVKCNFEICKTLTARINTDEYLL